MEDTISEDWIRRCYDPELSRQCGERLSELYATHLRRLQTTEKDFQTWVRPEENIVTSSSYLQTDFPKVRNDSEDRGAYLEGLVERFSELVSVCLERSQGLHHPRCAGHQVPAAMPLAGWFDAMTSLTNQVQGVYEMGPWSVAVERAILNAVGEVLGFPVGEFGSLVTSGGSLANLTALLAARQVQFPEWWKSGFMSTDQNPVVVVNQDAHYCVDRAVGVMGLGTDQLVSVPLDDKRRMDVDALRNILMDLRERDIPVLAVVAVAGTTACGAFDPLQEIAKVCDSLDVWLHVDAAHGGALKFSKRHQGQLDGLELADSVVVDAHKMLFVPALCAMVFFKKPEHQFAAFDQTAPYLFDPSEPYLAQYDNAVVTMECTKRASAMGLWGVWSVLGKPFFESLIDRVICVAKEFHREIEQAEDFQSWGTPSCNIVLFRYCGRSPFPGDGDEVNAFQLRLRRKMLEAGAGYLTQTKVDGQIYLRATIMNPIVDIDDLKAILQGVRTAAEQL